MSIFDTAEQRRENLKELKQKIHTVAENQIIFVANTIYGTIKEKAINEILSNEKLKSQDFISGCIDINNEFCDEYCHCALPHPIKAQIDALNMRPYDEDFYSIISNPYEYPVCTFSLRNIKYNGVICHRSFLKKSHYREYRISLSKAGEKVIARIKQLAAADNTSLDMKFVFNFREYSDKEIDNGGILKYYCDPNSRTPASDYSGRVFDHTVIRIKYLFKK